MKFVNPQSSGLGTWMLMESILNTELIKDKLMSFSAEMDEVMP